MPKCVFCQIVADKLPADKVAENEQALAFNDVNPKAPIHVLVVPKTHRQRPEELSHEEAAALFRLADVVAEKSGIRQSGFRLVINVGKHAGQEVEHVHLHVLGGRQSTGIF